MKAGVLLLLGLLSQGWTWAGNFQQAFDAALQSDASYQAARAEFASAQQNLPMARAGLLPSVSLSLSDTQVKGSLTADNASGQSVTSPLDYKAPVKSLSLRAPLFNREATQKFNQAQAQVSYAEAVFATRLADLVDRLASAYLQRLLSEQTVLAARAEVEAAQAQSDLTRRRLQLGEGTRPDLIEADAALDMARVLLREAQDQVSVARLSLKQITGIEQDSVATVADGFTPQAFLTDLSTSTDSLAELLNKANASNPSIAARRYAVAVTQAAVARNEAGHYPRLDLVASASYSSNESISTLNQSVNQRSLGLQLNLPIYSGGYVNAAVTQALADQDKAEAELAAEQQSVARELTKLYFSASNGAAKINAYQKAVESGKLSLEGARKGLSTGFNTQADVVLAQRKLAQSRRELAQAVYEYLLTRVRLFARTGAEPAQAVAHMDALLKLP